MNRTALLVASLLTLATAGLATAADTKPALPVISIQEVKAEDPATYALLIARNDEVARAKLGVERYYRVYVGQSAGKDTGTVFAVVAADSFATLAKNAAALADDPKLMASRGGLDAVRVLGSQIQLKAVRYDGTHPGAFLYNTQCNLVDEAAYLKSLDDLRALFDRLGFQDAKINAYRAVAGREEYTHLISINSPSAERRAALLDATQSHPDMAAWFASVAANRKVVRNGTYREITR